MAPPAPGSPSPTGRLPVSAEPDASLVLHADPSRMGFWAAARYVLRIPSNRLLIFSSALGYFLFAGLRTFAVIFARGRFGISEATVSELLVVIGAGAVAGTLLGGHLSDRLLKRSVADGRMLLGGGAFIAAAVLLVPGFLFHALGACLLIFVVAAALLSAPNPALDAADWTWSRPGCGVGPKRSAPSSAPSWRPPHPSCSGSSPRCSAAAGPA